jgi:hypothetical protein
MLTLSTLTWYLVPTSPTSGVKPFAAPEQVAMDYVDIPCAILDVHSRVTLVADVMFVNGVPFLVSASRNINLITIEHVPHRTAAKLGHLLQRIIKVYAQAGFTVQTILMDYEFLKVKDQVPSAVLNTSAAAEHIGKIERCIRVIKERSRGIICTLPYMRLPQKMLINLLHFIVMWLNNFPVSNGVSDRFSPRELILWHKLDYKHHCRAPFGVYCEVHEDNTHVTNSMKKMWDPIDLYWTHGEHTGHSTIFLAWVQFLSSNEDGLTNFRPRIPLLKGWQLLPRTMAYLLT